MPRREKEAAVTSLIPLSHKSLAPTQNTALRFLIRHTSSNLSQRGQKKNPTRKPIFVWVKACGALFAASPFFTPLPSYARFTLTAVHRPENSYGEEYLLAAGAPQLGACVCRARDKDCVRPSHCFNYSGQPQITLQSLASQLFIATQCSVSTHK